MESTLAFTFIGAVIVVGIGIGVYLQMKLEATNQNVHLPDLEKAA